MSYQDITIKGPLAEEVERWIGERYGRLVDIEVGGITEGNYAAVGYAAVENSETGAVDAVVLLLQHDPEAGSDRYRIKDMAEIEGPMVDYCPERILDQLTPTEDVLAAHWRDRCRERAAEIGRTTAFSMNS
jgi:hypothetical protein